MTRKKNSDEEIDVMDPEYSYNTLVKKRLAEWKEGIRESMGMDLNYSAISEAMYDRFGIEVSPVKVSAMFDPSKPREVKLRELSAVCQLFDIPIWDIVRHPGSASSGMNFRGLLRKKNKQETPVSPLSNGFYEGDYYCYYFRPKHFDDQLKPVEETEIEEALMSIRIKSGRTVLTLKELKNTSTFYGKPMPSFTLSGDLYHFENTDIAYGFINDPSGRRAMSIMFSFLNLSADVRYYMTAGVMMFSLNQRHDPLFEKMAIFRQRQDYTGKDEDVIRGILSLNSGPLVLDQETCQKLIEEDPSLENALSLSRALKKCYVFSETAIRSELFSVTDSDQKTAKQLRIRQKSLFPAHEVISEPDCFADFIKKYQQTQMKENEKEK